MRGGVTIPLLAGDGLHFEPVSTWHPEVCRAIAAHYTGGGGAPPGKKAAWLAWEDRALVGVIGIGEPAFKLSPRRRLGIEDARPLDHTVCCWIARFTGNRQRSGDILRTWHPLAASYWAHRYGWAPVHWETMVGNATEGGREHHGGALGACFRRSGYRSLGWTTGWGARRPGGSTRGPRAWELGNPKLVLYRGPLPRLAPPAPAR